MSKIIGMSIDSLPSFVQPAVAWLAAPVNGSATRVPLSGLVLDHAVLAFFGGAVLLPWVLLITRYFKVRPGQDWPRQLDDPLWRRVHHWGGALTVLVVGAACALAFLARGGHRDHLTGGHDILGGLALLLLVIVGLQSMTRGSRGGPTHAQLRTLGPYHGVAGDHYDMTDKRQRFQHLHRWLGVTALVAVLLAALAGLWRFAPRWVLLVTLLWWSALLWLAVRYERQGRCIDTYQAIWGPGLEHPGNRIPAIGWRHLRYDEAGFEALAWARHRSRLAWMRPAPSPEPLPASHLADMLGPDTAATMALNEAPETIFMADDEPSGVPTSGATRTRTGPATPAQAPITRTAPVTRTGALPRRSSGQPAADGAPPDAGATGTATQDADARRPRKPRFSGPAPHSRG